MKKVFISQSNYIPWRGYFNAIDLVDEFVIYDDVQYTRRDWRNRNRIKTSKGDIWLTIPIEVKNRYFQKIEDARISDHSWAQHHWQSLKTNYSKSPYFKQYAPLFEALYLGKTYTHLTEVNYDFIRLICSILKISTRISYSKDFNVLDGSKSEKLLRICKTLEATDYYSGPSAKNYLEESVFNQNNVNVHYFDFSGLEPYPQQFGSFSNNVSVLDLIFNTGPDAYKYLSLKYADHALLPELILA
ncbi:MAG TPA: WbqC family protein [Bacteroidia bacterium]|jgi:hypothetical protein